MLDCKKHLFDLPDDVHYFNCASMGPILKSAVQVGQLAIEKKLRPFNYTRSDFFDPANGLRTNFAKLIHSDEPARIAIIPSVSYAMANAANNIDFSKKKTILIVGDQFPSNVYAWQDVAERNEVKIQIVTAPKDHPNGSISWSQKIIEQINEDTAAIAMGHLHWADGTLFDLKAIRQKTHDYGAAMIIDGTQSIGAFPFDLREIEVDALICSAYKWLLGPYSIGLAYYGPYFDEGAPIENSWLNRKDSDQFEHLAQYQKDYRPKAARYNVGEYSNFINLSILDMGIQQILAWQPQNIQNYCKHLLSEYLPVLESLGCIINKPPQLAHHLFGIRLPGYIDTYKLKQYLDQEKVFISIRANAVRVSLNVYNNKRDFEKLIFCLKKFLIQ